MSDTGSPFGHSKFGFGNTTVGMTHGDGDTTGNKVRNSFSDTFDFRRHSNDTDSLVPFLEFRPIGSIKVSNPILCISEDLLFVSPLLFYRDEWSFDMCTKNLSPTLSRSFTMVE
jgi:hypothetical protein